MSVIRQIYVISPIIIRKMQTEPNYSSPDIYSISGLTTSMICQSPGSEDYTKGGNWLEFDTTGEE